MVAVCCALPGPCCRICCLLAGIMRLFVLCADLSGPRAIEIHTDDDATVGNEAHSCFPFAIPWFFRSFVRSCVRACVCACFVQVSHVLRKYFCSGGTASVPLYFKHHGRRVRQSNEKLTVCLLWVSALHRSCSWITPRHSSTTRSRTALRCLPSSTWPCSVCSSPAVSVTASRWDLPRWGGQTDR